MSPSARAAAHALTLVLLGCGSARIDLEASV